MDGLTVATLSNTGIEFYTWNEIHSIDFEMMSTLIQMNSLTELIDSKMEKLIDFIYPSFLLESPDSKVFLIMYLKNLMESETQIVQLYENFMEENNID